MSDPPTGTVTFLFTDIEGSTKTWERNPSVMQKALSRHDEILRSAIEASRGYMFKTVGDAFCAAFGSASVLTLEDSTLLWMERRTFLSSMEEMPTIARNLVGILSRRLRLADTHIRSLAALDVQGRVAAQLLAFAREYGEPLPDGGTLIPLRLTQTDLADLVGASRVRVNQTLGYYRKRGSISLNKDHRIIVREEESLARRAR